MPFDFIGQHAPRPASAAADGVPSKHAQEYAATRMRNRGVAPAWQWARGPCLILQPPSPNAFTANASWSRTALQFMTGQARRDFTKYSHDRPSTALALVPVEDRLSPTQGGEAEEEDTNPRVVTTEERFMSPPCKAQLPRYGASNRQDLHVDFSFSKGRRAHHRQVSTEPPVFFLVHNGPNDSQRSSVSTGLEHDAGGDALLQPGDAGGLGLGPFGAAMRPDRRARELRPAMGGGLSPGGSQVEVNLPHVDFSPSVSSLPRPYRSVDVLRNT